MLIISYYCILIFVEGIDFMRVSVVRPVLATNLPTPISTVSIPGIQGTRSFTVRLLPNNPFNLHRLTNINGTVTINIFDDPTNTGRDCIG